MKKVILYPSLLVLIGILPSLYTHNANPVLIQVARAQQIIPTATDGVARKWEYCSLILIYNQKKSKDGKYTVTTDICYDQSTGCRRERTVSQEYLGDVHDDARARAIAKLGEDGWEMFLFTPSPGTSYEYYFRRRKM